MGSSYLRYDGFPEDGRAHVVEPGGSDPRRHHARKPRCMEHLLRYSPLWRPADFLARASMREIAGAVERPGIDGGFSDPGGCAQSDAHIRDPVSLASRPYKPIGSQDCAAIRSLVGRDRG